jgi:hypothetical protein
MSLIESGGARVLSVIKLGTDAHTLLAALAVDAFRSLMRPVRGFSCAM